MTGPLLVLLVIGAVGLVPAALLYLRREPHVRGRGILLAVRLASLSVLGLLLLNPILTGRDPVHGGEGATAFWVLVDPDPALRATDEDGVALWEHAVSRAGERARGRTRLARVSGDAPEGVDLATLTRGVPAETPGTPGDALLGLAEAGADSILLLSPLRRPVEPLAQALARIPVPVRVERIGGVTRNAAVAELVLPRGAGGGEPLDGSLLLAGEGGEPGDSVHVTVTANGATIFETTAPLPAAGSPVRIPLELAPPPDTGQVRFAARATLAGDLFSPDDERVRVVRIGEPEGGIVLVSVRPDWEPRTLLPVLERATGLEGAGFLRVGSERYVPLVAGGEPLIETLPGALARRAASAELLVIHGVTDDLPEAFAPVVSGHPRVLHLPAGPGGAALGGVTTGPARDGEWMPDPDPPPSPVAPFLSGRPLGGLPPLTGVLVPTAPAPGVRALGVRSPRGGPAEPALLLVDDVRGRRAVALASGFWRWGAREGEAREVYRNLWAGTAGWLLAHDALAGPARVRPEEPVLPRGVPMPWEAPGFVGAEVRVELREADGDPDAAPLRTHTARVDDGGRFALPSLPPGRYRWEATVTELAASDAPGPDLPEPSAGVVEIEAFLDALLLPAADPDSLTRVTGTEADPALRAGLGRPLRTHPLPWIVLLSLLCIEWLGRRRVGLR